jgi:O-acetyl-ADP-ribose deacetylase (regulator of RNase III)
MNEKQIILKRGDITQSDCDAIVNAANVTLLGGGGVDGAIHRAAGPQLLMACKELPSIDGVRCPVGEARITEAGNLKCQYVIHTVGPNYFSDPVPARHLEQAYRSSLSLALQMDLTSIAFPAISCGIYGYPLAEAACIALNVCAESQYSSLKIVFYLFDNQLFDIYLNTFQQFKD